MSAETGPDVARMTLAVAKAICTAASGADVWDELEPGEQRDFTEAAFAAIGAHDGWLLSKGFKIIPPGTIVAPETREEASAMMVAARNWLDAHPRPGFAMPRRPKLVVEH